MTDYNNLFSNIKEQDQEVEIIKSIFDNKNVDWDEISRQLIIYISIDSDGFQVIIDREITSITYLPPLQLNCFLHDNYPSLSMPKFYISSCWLSKKNIIILEEKLNQLYIENTMVGIPIIYDWCEWIKSNTFVYLKLIENHDIIEETLPKIVKYNISIEEETFMTTLNTCNICFEDLPGSKFVKLPDCLHKFCNICIKDMCTVHTNDGTVEMVCCPEPMCKSSIPIEVIRNLIGEKLYNRYNYLIEDRLFGKMGYIYCPRCSKLVKDIDIKEHCGRCSNCNYSICTLCMGNWHPKSIKCMSSQDKLQMLELRNVSSNRSKLEAQRLKQIQQDLREEVLTKNSLSKNSKQCPKCNFTITKDGGCNKITCIMCMTIFCWKCNKEIIGYDHFKDDSKCDLWAEEDIKRWEQQMNNPGNFAIINQAPVIRNNDEFIRCVNCTQYNIRIGNCNYIRCWHCNKGSCFNCKDLVINYSKHYINKAGYCKQHS